MDKPNNIGKSEAERRHFAYGDRPVMSGVPVRTNDIEPVNGLHSVAILFRVLAVLLGVIIVLQISNGVTSTVDISYGVLLAEVIRLVIFAGLLWGAGDLADLFVQSHHDLRCMRILLARLNHLAAQASGAEPRSDDGEAGRGRGDATH